MRQKNRGFSLIEVLVAFSILALSMGVLFGIFGKGVNNITLSEDYMYATVMAESQLAAIGAGNSPIEEGEYDGEYDERFHWEMKITPYEAGSEESGWIDMEIFALEAFLIELTVLWEDDNAAERSLSMTTMRLQVPGQE